MELCAARGVSDFSSILQKPIAPKHIQSLFHCKAQIPCVVKQTRSCSGLKYFVNSSLRSATSGETSTESTPYGKDKSELDDVIIVDDGRRDEKEKDGDTQSNEAQQEGFLGDISLQLFKFLGDLDIKLEYEEIYSVLVFGGGGIAAFWLATAVVGAIDSVPLFPKVLELIGLGYTLWFSSRFLIFKENRDELVDRIEQIKRQVLGSDDD